MSEALSMSDVGTSQSRGFWGVFFKKFGMLVVLVALMLLMGLLTGGRFLRPVNLMNVLEQVTPVGIIAVGVTLVIITGGIDLSLGSVIALAGVAGAVISKGSGGTLAALLMVAVLGAAAGLVNGSIVAFAKVPPFIVTLGMMTAARGMAAIVSKGRPVGLLPDGMVWLGQERILGIPGVVYLYLLVAFLAYMLLSKMRFGRHLYAIGGNANAARLCGVHIERTLLWVYMLCGLTAGISGFVLVTTTTAGNPTYGLSYELDAIASTVIGGTSLSGGFGSIPLCVVGALIIGIINNGLNLLGVDPYWQQVVKGAIIVAAVLLDKLKRQKS